jgi:hypothetical protein
MCPRACPELVEGFAPVLWALNLDSTPGIGGLATVAQSIQWAFGVRRRFSPVTSVTPVVKAFDFHVELQSLFSRLRNSAWSTMSLPRSSSLDCDPVACGNSLLYNRRDLYIFRHWHNLVVASEENTAPLATVAPAEVIPVSLDGTCAPA